MASEPTSTPTPVITRWQLRYLPGYARFFVALVTGLMVFVTLFAAWLYTVESGQVDPTKMPAYLLEGSAKPIPADLAADLDEIAADSALVAAPIWDTLSRGQEHEFVSEHDHREEVIDSLLATSVPAGYGLYGIADSGLSYRGKTLLRENLGLAHTHVNGQTLLFFALGLLYCLTSQSAGRKKLLLGLFGGLVLLHNGALVGRGFHPLFDDLLMISGIGLLSVIIYYAAAIAIDLARPITQERLS